MLVHPGNTSASRRVVISVNPASDAFINLTRASCAPDKTSGAGRPSEGIQRPIWTNTRRRVDSIPHAVKTIIRRPGARCAIRSAN